MVLNTEIARLARQVEERCVTWLKHDGGGGCVVIDPIDKMPIKAHYAASHFSAGLILSGIRRKDETVLNDGLNLLHSVLTGWEADHCLPGYHCDFNNFALCIVFEALSSLGGYEDILNSIKAKVLEARDSDHDTVNWLPMRLFVNKSRFEWTQDSNRSRINEGLIHKINQAIYKDGLIDDRLPKGKSFNLQYNIATVALLQFLRCRGYTIDLSVNLGALLSVVAPDGDINYVGRGTNQVFAWGLWIYLLASSKNESSLGGAIEYLGGRLQGMLDNNNLMLNDYSGADKILWWDYHYCSVYTAHLYLWLELALLDYGNSEINPRRNGFYDSGLMVFKNDRSFLTLFGGRKEYLAERGPSIAALWTTRNGMLFKGGFGPWGGDFGRRYEVPGIVLRNFIGLMNVEKKGNHPKSRISKMLGINGESIVAEAFVPLFPKISINDASAGLRIVFQCESPHLAFFNFPVFLTSKFDVRSCSLTADGKPVELFNVMDLRNQYQWCALYQSREIEAKEWQLMLYY
jgi:hypothetical protein